MPNPVPTRPTLDDQDYALGQDPEWLDRFAEGTGHTRQAAVNLQNQGSNLSGASQQAQNRATPQTDFSRAQGVGARQTGAADWLSSFARGPQGPSAAQATLRQGANEAMAGNLALARSGSGFGEGATALSDAQRANASTMAQTANQAAQLRAQEDQAFRGQQLQAMGTAADIYGGARGAEAGEAQFLTDAELQAAAQRDALQLGLGQQSIDAQQAGISGSLAAQELGLGATQAELDARIARDQTRAGIYGTDSSVFAERNRRDEAQREARRADRGEAAGFIGGVAGGAAALLSDERSKRNVRSASIRARYEALRD